jgi:hypothetical protein
MSEFACKKGAPQVGRENSPTLLDCHSSSQETASCRVDGQKEKRQPSITPRKFNRFFSPRSNASLAIKLPRGALEDITAPAINRNGTQSSPIRPFNNGKGVENSPTTFTREMKRRKLLHMPSPSPDDSASEKRYLLDQRHVFEDSFPDDHNYLHSLQHSASAEDSLQGPRKLELPPLSTPTKHIKQLESRGLAGRLLQLSLRSGAAFKGQRLDFPDNG